MSVFDVSLYPIVKHRIKLIKNDLKIQRQTVLELEEQLKTCYVNLDIDFEPEILNKYKISSLLLELYLNLKKSGILSVQET